MFFFLKGVFFVMSICYSFVGIENGRYVTLIKLISNLLPNQCLFFFSFNRMQKWDTNRNIKKKGIKVYHYEKSSN